MFGIVIEGALFLAAVAGAGVLAFTALKRYTPLGVRLTQAENRRRILLEETLVCPTHGRHEEKDLVRLPGGDLLCPECYAETVNGKLLR
ncbi:MAG: hypothetical protein HY275_12700 [Gemmatimonadetes bacterium]|nr:hypothetical protein [Gemmatimonadota bacterium]